MKTNNTITAFHIWGEKDGVLKLNTNKMYHWNIPKRLRDNPIEKRDIVLVSTAQSKARVLVMDIFQEELKKRKGYIERLLK